MLTILLLIAISWLLWTIHQDLMESNDRQRTLKSELSKLTNSLDQSIDANAPKEPPTSPASKQDD
jgi:hypothetical protein